jgi:hypothetical protein
VADYSLRVDVVLAKRLDEVGPEDRGVVRTEVVGEEVHEAGEEVGGQVSKDRQDGCEPQVPEVGHPPVNLNGYQDYEQCKTQDA